MDLIPTMLLRIGCVLLLSKYARMTMLMRCDVVRRVFQMAPQDSALFYALLESWEGVAFFRTLDSPGSNLCEVELSIPVSMKREAQEALDRIGESLSLLEVFSD